MDLVQCRVHGAFLSVNETSTVPAVVLDVGDGSFITVYIGLSEAMSIGRALNKDTSIRPSTHDLFMEVMKTFHISMEALHIDALEESVYYGKMILSRDGIRQIIDCRPSDGIAIALRADAPILVEQEVVRNTAVPREELPRLVDLPHL
jgi:bifunctional DNase/RNase